VHDSDPGDLPRRGLATDLGVTVVYPDGEDEAPAMAAMLAGLITANVEQHPERLKDFHALSGQSVCIEVPDIEQSLTLTFAGDDLVVRSGRRGSPAVSITANSDVVMALNLVKAGPLGLPNYFDAAGRDVVKALVTRRLRIGGMWRVDTLNRVTRLFSVA
jgi:hypothetical protein